MGIASYFFDTYAFYEILHGNPNYTPYLTHVSFVTTRLQLMELYYALLRVKNKTFAQETYASLLPYCVDFSDELVWAAMQFKHLHRQKKLSYIDCLGYMISLSLHIPFLTGDQQFEGLPSVEFVR